MAEQPANVEDPEERRGDAQHRLAQLCVRQLQQHDREQDRGHKARGEERVADVDDERGDHHQEQTGDDELGERVGDGERDRRNGHHDHEAGEDDPGAELVDWPDATLQMPADWSLREPNASRCKGLSAFQFQHGRHVYPKFFRTSSAGWLRSYRSRSPRLRDPL